MYPSFANPGTVCALVPVPSRKLAVATGQQTAMPPARQFSEADVHQLARKEKDRHIFIYKNRVYAVDAEDLMHPGGPELLDANRGKDITELFEGGEGGHDHSKAAHLLLERYYRGDLVGENGKALPTDPATERQRILAMQAASQEGIVDESKGLLNQVMELDPAVYMAWIAVPSTGHPHMFNSKLVERLTSAPWWSVPLIWLPISAYVMWLSVVTYGVGLKTQALLFPIGVLVWQLFEYCVHRFAFHFDPKTPSQIKTHFLMHGHHHKYPMDFERLVFPPAPAFLVASLWYLLLIALAPMGIAYGLFSGGIMGYVLYDTTHYALHRGGIVGRVLVGGNGAKLKNSHMYHHYEDESSGFGISSRLYDFVFGTLPKVKVA